jgi:ParB family chromosome partitioning protein
VLERARIVAAQTPRPSSTEALKTLIQRSTGKARPLGSATWLNGEGHQVATMSTDRKGRVTVSVDRLEEGQLRRLIKLLDGFLGVKSE